jgi:hypothetical protein
MIPFLEKSVYNRTVKGEKDETTESFAHNALFSCA